MTTLLEIALENRPMIHRAGLSLHGYKAVEKFILRGMWSLHLYLYRGSLKFSGCTYAFEPQCMSLAPPDIEVEWSFPSHASHYYIHFNVTPDLMKREVRVINFLPESFQATLQDMEFIANHYRELPLDTSVRLWDLLLKLSNGTTASKNNTPIHPTVQIASSIIENNLHAPLNVSDIARKTGVSINHLSRLFKKSMGITTLDFIHQRRKEKAVHLIRNTSLPIKTIASAVGIPDLHDFNKFIRKQTGSSPSNLRVCRNE